jgi:methylmalonyl-CoA mutase cobalamin-binding subunit
MPLPLPLSARETPGVEATPPAAPVAVPVPAASIHDSVLSLVAGRICRGNESRGDPDSCLDMLCAAAIESETAFDRALVLLRSQHGLDDAAIVDSYIPAAARRLGTDWTENNRSFAEVTIGTARLIRAVREISAVWNADAAADCRAPMMLMVVPEAEQHRLGAMVAASRFRRLGVSVQMLLGSGPQEILDRARNGAFDLLSFSLATPSRVEETRRVIHMIRDTLSPVPPIVVGGAIAMGAEELKSHLGADHVATDPEQALRLCGLSCPGRGNARPAR